MALSVFVCVAFLLFWWHCDVFTIRDVLLGKWDEIFERFYLMGDGLMCCARTSAQN